MNFSFSGTLLINMNLWSLAKALCSKRIPPSIPEFIGINNFVPDTMLKSCFNIFLSGFSVFRLLSSVPFEKENNHYLQISTSLCHSDYRGKEAANPPSTFSIFPVVLLSMPLTKTKAAMAMSSVLTSSFKSVLLA